MDILTAIETRRSIRAYLNKPVSKEIISKILEAAVWAPSGTNCQPWNIYAVTGETLENIKRENTQLFLAGVEPSIEDPPLYGIFKQRRKELAIQLFQLMDIKREDTEKRKQWTTRGYRFFDAPAALIFTVSNEMLEGTGGLLGIGSIIQTACLAAMEYGLGTCINEQGVSYFDPLRKYAGISKDELIVIGVSLGYPDPAFPANHLTGERAPLSDVVHWIGFEG